MASRSSVQLKSSHALIGVTGSVPSSLEEKVLRAGQVSGPQCLGGKPGMGQGLGEAYDLVGVRGVRPPWGGHKFPGSSFYGPAAQHVFPAMVRTGS